LGVLTYCYFPVTLPIGSDPEYETYVAPIVTNTISLILRDKVDGVTDINTIVDRNKLHSLLNGGKDYVDNKELISQIRKEDIDYAIVVQILYRPWKTKISGNHEVYNLIRYYLKVVDVRSGKTVDTYSLDDDTSFIAFQKAISDTNYYSFATKSEEEKYKAFIATPLLQYFSWIGFYRFVNDVTGAP